MRFAVAAASAALVAGASAQNSTAYVTEVVSQYTTYCPYATSQYQSLLEETARGSNLHFQASPMAPTPTLSPRPPP